MFGFFEAFAFGLRFILISGISVIAIQAVLPLREQTIKDRMRHSYIIGQTGTGKSTFCINQVLWAIKNDYSGMFIDVHGKDSVDILDCIPPDHIDRVVYIDPTNDNSVIGIPLLSGGVELATEALISIFDTLWPGFIGPSTEDVLRMAALAVLPNGGNLLDVYLMIVDENYRDSVQIKDDVVREFWKVTFPDLIKKDKSRLNPPTNKLRKLIMSKVCRQTLCQSNPKFDMGKAMDENKFIICNFSKRCVRSRYGKFTSGFNGVQGSA